MRTDRSSHGDALRRGLTTIVLVAFVVYVALPLVWLVMAATKSTGDLFSTFGLWFGGDFNLWQNIVELFTYDDGVYVRWVLNTALYATVSGGGAALFATAGGYAFAKFDFRGKRTIFAVVLGTIMVPSTALVIPTYLLMSRFGLVNTPIAVILPSLISPFGLYLMRIYAEAAVPTELLEAARVDGAGEVRIFFRIVFPVLTPAFVTVLLLSFVMTWNNFFLPLVMLSEPRYYPLTVGLASWNAQASAAAGAQGLFALVVTGSLVAIVPLVIAFVALQRYWQSGLATGSVK
jgi:multiple sugar transport system permease protein